MKHIIFKIIVLSLFICYTEAKLSAQQTQATKTEQTEKVKKAKQKKGQANKKARKAKQQAGEKMQNQKKKNTTNGQMKRAQKQKTDKGKARNAKNQNAGEKMNKAAQENKGKAYGKNKGDLQGKAFGQERVRQAKMNKSKKLEEMDVDFTREIESLEGAKNKIDLTRETLMANKIAGKISEQEYKAEVAKVEKAEMALEKLKKHLDDARLYMEKMLKK